MCSHWVCDVSSNRLFFFSLHFLTFPFPHSPAPSAPQFGARPMTRVFRCRVLGVSASSSTFVLVCACRKLHCPRNTVHVNLFSSFILRCVMALVRDLLLADGVGHQDDTIHYADGVYSTNSTSVTHHSYRYITPSSSSSSSSDRQDKTLLYSHCDGV